MSECHDTAVLTAPSNSKRHLVAMVGPPNSGKSTLFNRLTGLRQKVANFPGVTVEHRSGKVRVLTRDVYVLDLPGVYSLQPRTEDERITHDALLGQLPEIGRPDGVLLILDATNLARHLVLAAPVLSLGLPTLVVLNMADDFADRGGSVDLVKLSKELGAPVPLHYFCFDTLLASTHLFLPKKFPLLSFHFPQQPYRLLYIQVLYQ